MLYVPDDLESVPQSVEPSTSLTSSHNVCNTGVALKRQSMESETSFDSGYFSPLASGRNSFTPVMQQPPLYTSNMVQQSPSKIAMMASVIDELTSKPIHDLPVLDDWDKNFIGNFDEDLFTLDNYEDVGLLEGLFKSPMKSPLRILSPAKGHGSKFSPHKMAVHKSPYKSPYIRSPYKLEGYRKGTYTGGENKVNMFHKLSTQTALGRNDDYHSVPTMHHQQTAPSVHPAETVTTNALAPRILSPTENRHTQAYVGIPLTHLSGSNPKRMRLDSRSATHPRQIRKTKENSEPYSSKQKLQIARANFRHSLEKALETAASRSFHQRSEQYPQLSKALSKPSTAVALSPTDGNANGLLDGTKVRNTSPIVGNPYLEEDAEIPSSWFGGAGSEVGSYEVEPQAGCKVVIRKRKR